MEWWIKPGSRFYPLNIEDILAYKEGCFIVGQFFNPEDKELYVSDSIGGLVESDETYNALIDGYGKYLIPFGEYESVYIDNDGYVHGGHWTGKYHANLYSIRHNILKTASIC